MTLTVQQAPGGITAGNALTKTGRVIDFDYQIDQDVDSTATPTFDAIRGLATSLRMITDESGSIEVNPDTEDLNVILRGFGGNYSLVMAEDASYFDGPLGVGTSTPASDGGTGFMQAIKGAAQYQLYLASTSATGDNMLAFGQQNQRRSYIQTLDSGDLFRVANEYGPIVFLTGTGGSEVERFRIDASDGAIDFSEDVGDKVLWYDNTYGTGIETGTLTDWVQTRRRIRVGGTSPSGGTDVFNIDANDATFSTNVYVSSGHNFIAKSGNGILVDGDGSAAFLDIDLTDVGADPSQSSIRIYRDTNTTLSGVYPEFVIHRGDGTFNPQFDVDCNTQNVTVYDGDFIANNDIYVGEDIIHNGDADTYQRYGTNTWDLVLGGTTVFDGSSTGMDVNVFLRQLGRERQASNADAASTTLAQLSTLSETVVAGRKYAFEAYVPFSVTGAGAGIKFGMSGSCTATSVIYNVKIENNTTGVHAGGQLTALGSSVGVSGNVAGFARIVGSIDVNAGGTLGVYFAANSPSGPTVRCLAGGYLKLTELT